MISPTPKASAEHWCLTTMQQGFPYVNTLNLRSMPYEATAELWGMRENSTN